MKTILTTTALILVLASPVLAGETLPAQAQRIWAPTGDLIGLQNHATATLVIKNRGRASVALRSVTAFAEGGPGVISAEAAGARIPAGDEIVATVRVSSPEVTSSGLFLGRVKIVINDDLHALRC